MPTTTIKRPYTKLYIALENERTKQQEKSKTKSKPKPVLWFSLRNKSSSYRLLSDSDSKSECLSPKKKI